MAIVSKARGIALLLFFTFSPLAAQEKDVGLWLYSVVNKDINESWDFLFFSEYRFAKGASRLESKIIHGVFLYGLFSNCQIGPGYRHRYDYDEKGRVSEIHAPIMEAFITWSGDTADILVRPRLEYRIRRHLKNEWQYRQYMEASLTFLELKGEIIPFIAEEFFWREGQGIRENRIRFGLPLCLNEAFTLTPAFMFRTRRAEDRRWLRSNIILCTLLYEF